MQLEILVEDASGKRMLEHLVPRILENREEPRRYRIINIQELKHRMMAKMPRDRARTIPWDELLFETLRAQLRNYANAFSRSKPKVIVVVVDIDYHDYEIFLSQLESLLDDCEPKPQAVFALAVEEGEAWLLGDRTAVKIAYPFAKDAVLEQYVQDSICGTWEFLADAVYRGGSDRLSAIGYPEIGRVKFEWAERISPHVDAARNQSPSFQRFCEKLNQITDKNTFSG